MGLLNLSVSTANNKPDLTMETEKQTEATSAPEQFSGSAPSAPALEAVSTKPPYMQGWRLYMLTAGIWIALFLSTLETTIISTSLVAIADALSGFDERNWVVTAYFLTYTGTLLIYPFVDMEASSSFFVIFC